MLVVDDVLFFPVKSIFWVFREIHHAAHEETANEAQRLTTELSDLYMMLETGKITEAEFDGREKILLDRLEAIEKRGDLKTAEGQDDP